MADPGEDYPVQSAARPRHSEHYKPEPWHFRYLGRDRAVAVHAAGVSPREWLWDHANDDS
jgi:hypothetical protein